jgi:hypothetical protein
LDIKRERESELVATGHDVSADAADHTNIGGHRIRMSDLLEAGLIQPGDELVWERPRLGVTYRANVAESGAIELPGRR